MPIGLFGFCFGPTRIKEARKSVACHLLSAPFRVIYEHAIESKKTKPKNSPKTPLRLPRNHPKHPQNTPIDHFFRPEIQNPPKTHQNAPKLTQKPPIITEKHQKPRFFCRFLTSLSASPPPARTPLTRTLTAGQRYHLPTTTCCLYHTAHLRFGSFGSVLKNYFGEECSDIFSKVEAR